MNPMHLHDKLNWDKALELPMMKQLRESMPDNVREIFDDFVDDPMSLGIAMKNDIYAFGYIHESKTYFGMTMALHSRSSFEDLLSKTGVMIAVKEEDEYKYFDGGNAFVGWTSGLVLVVGSQDLSEGTDLKAEFERLLALSDEEQLQNTDADFEEYIKTSHDFSLWACSNPFAEIVSYEMQKQTGGVFALTEDDIKDNRIHMYMDFEKGEINMVQEFLPNEKLKSKNFPEKMLKKAIDKKLLDMIPGDNLIGGMGWAVNIQGMMELITGAMPPQFSAMLVEAPKQVGLTQKELLELVGGDAFVGFYGFFEVRKANDKSMISGMDDFFKDEMGEEEEFNEFFEEMEKLEGEIEESEPDTITISVPNIIIAFTVKEDLMKKLLTEATKKIEENPMVSQMTGITMIDSSYYKFRGKFDMVMAFTNGVGFVSSNEDFIKKVADGNYKPGKKIQGDFSEMLSNYPFSGFMNLQTDKLPENTTGLMADAMGGEMQFGMFKNFMGLFKDARFFVKDYKAEMKITLTEDDEYALYKILERIDAVISQ